MTSRRLKRKIDKLFASNILKFSKRQRFVLSTIFLTSGLLTTQLLPSSKSFVAISLLTLMTLLLGIWSLWEELDGIEYLTLITPLLLYTVGLGLFYFLLPFRWITRVPVAFLYAVGIYALFLVGNIYNVAAIRTIALSRAAHTVSFFFSLITSFFLFNTLFSFHLPSVVNFIFIFTISLLLFLPSFWSEKLNPFIDKSVFLLSVSFAFIMGEIAFVLSFWPLKGAFESLYLVSVLYILMGAGQNKLKDLPLKKTILEYVFLSLLAIVMLIKTSAWEI